MATSKLLSLQIADIVRWYREKELVINETFQRRAVWTTAAKTYLLDTILSELPLPKFYLRSKINPRTQRAIREIVDGQQRVRAIAEFANNELRLTSRSEQYVGLKYEDLDDDAKTRFLGYTISVEQLLNATDDDVLEVFARLNSYTVNLNAAEKRHAKYQTEFKWAVRKAATEHKAFWERHNILTIKERFRMADDALMAEMFGIFLEGVRDGGARNIDRLYKEQDDQSFTKRKANRNRANINKAINYLDTDMAPALSGSFSRPYHVLMMLAAYAHHTVGIPQGQIEVMPPRTKLAPVQTILDRLSGVAEALDSEDPPKRFREFVIASQSSTHRISSRRIRFLEMVRVFGA